MTELYPLLRELHFILSRVALLVGVLMFVIAFYIGITKKRDVTPLFRRATYAVTGLMALEFALGGMMYLIGGRPGQDVHIIYGLGVLLALPFFIFVEVTANKRPAMGSYIWGFALVSLILIRSIMTGPHG